MKLSPHFTLDELTRSNTAKSRKIDNTPTPAIIEALKELCENVLEPVREFFGAPVVVTSGYRSPILNKAVGGSATSDHCKGFAADFTVKGYSNVEVCQWIAANCDYKQLIYEYGEPEAGGSIHCAYAVGNNKKVNTTAKRDAKGRTIYVKGLPK